MIAAVENAMIAALKNASDNDVLGYKYSTLESYPENFDAYLKEKVELRTPGAWALFLGMPEGENLGDGSGWTGRASFALVVAAQHLRNETASRHGDGTTPGSYQMAIDAIRLIDGSMLGLDLVRPMEARAMRPIARDGELRRQGLSLMAIEFHCTVPLGQFADEGNVAEFRTFHADWDVPPFGNVTPPLPAVDPDAADTVELPQ